MLHPHIVFVTGSCFHKHRILTTHCIHLNVAGGPSPVGTKGSTHVVSHKAQHRIRGHAQRPQDTHRQRLAAPFRDLGGPTQQQCTRIRARAKTPSVSTSTANHPCLSPSLEPSVIAAHAPVEAGGRRAPRGRGRGQDDQPGETVVENWAATCRCTTSRSPQMDTAPPIARCREACYGCTHCGC